MTRPEPARDDDTVRLARQARPPGPHSARRTTTAWLIPIGILTGLCLCLGAGYVFFANCPTYWPNFALCPAGARPRIHFFEAIPSEVDETGTVVIMWDVVNADKVELTDPVQQSLDQLFGVRVYNIGRETTFTLRATNYAGSTEQSVTVRVVGAVSPP